MQRPLRYLALLSLAAGVLFTACGESASDEAALEEPVTIEHLKGSEVARIELTKEAVNRLEIRTVPVWDKGERLVVPSAAVLVDPDGKFWVYTSPQPLLFVREGISLDHEE